jgi:hypothetical protein
VLFLTLSIYNNISYQYKSPIHLVMYLDSATESGHTGEKNIS